MPIIPAPPTPTTSMLDDVYTACNENSYFSRSLNEIWRAINGAGFEIYCAVVKESEGFYVKVDESTVALAAGVNTYELPNDCSQIMHLAEKSNVGDDWRPMTPGSLNSVAVVQNFDAANWFNYGGSSAFQYWPYQDTELKRKMQIAPNPTHSHLVQLIYAASWVPLKSDTDICMLPLEAQTTLESKATARLLRLNGDNLSAEYEATGNRELTLFLTWLRNRQIQQLPQIEPFLGWSF